MGVKSTVTLTRSQAEERYVALRQRQIEKGIEWYARALSNQALEEALEALNDELSYNGQGFDNYAIIPDDER